MKTVYDNIHHFFAAYAECLTTFDSKQLSLFYVAPVTMINDDTVIILTDFVKMDTSFQAGLNYYKRIGLAKATADVMGKEPITNKITKVKILWHYYNTGNELIYTCYHQYLLKHDPAKGWKIAIAINVDELAKAKEWESKNSN